MDHDTTNEKDADMEATNTHTHTPKLAFKRNKKNVTIKQNLKYSFY